MSIFRVEKNKNYTVMSNHHLRDKKLSLKAIGLLSIILSLPDNWNYSQAGLAAICKDGEDSVRGGLKELEQQGYLIRERSRAENGKMSGMVYHIYEVPQGAWTPQDRLEKHMSSRLKQPGNSSRKQPERHQDISTHSNKPTLKNPTLGNPMTDISQQIKTEKERKNQANIDGKINPPTNQSRRADGYDGYNSEKIRAELRSIFRKKIGYDLFVFKQTLADSQLANGIITIEQYDQEIDKHNIKTLDKVIEYVIDVLTSQSQSPIKIGDELIDREVVKTKLLSCGIHEIKRVVEELNTNPSIKNPKKYSISMLYNA